MTHYVLLKFKPGTDLDAVEASVRETYEKLDQLLPFLTAPIVFRNCVNRDSNADLMAVVQLDSSEHLLIIINNGEEKPMKKQNIFASSYLGIAAVWLGGHFGPGFATGAFSVTYYWYESPAPEGNHHYRIHRNSFSGHPGFYDRPLPSWQENGLRYCPQKDNRSLPASVIISSPIVRVN